MTRVVYLKDEWPRDLFEEASCAFGVFDGVHRGHRFLIAHAITEAQLRGGGSLVLTFSADPDEIVGSKEFFKLMSNRKRIAALAETGVDAVAVIPFDEEFSRMPPEDFLYWAFGEKAPYSLHVGSDFRFGARAAGTVETLKQWGIAYGVAVCGHPLLRDGDSVISATRIRLLLREGKREEAEALAGHLLD